MIIKDIEYILRFILRSIILFIFLFPICGLSQGFLKGVVFEYDKNVKIPLDSVYIYNFHDTIPTISDSNGYFEFYLPIKNKNHWKNHIIKNIKKEGYLILNNNAIEFTNKESEIQILMCKEIFYNNQFNLFYNIGLNSYEEDNNSRLTEYKSKREAKEISDTEYNNLLNNYYDSYISYRKVLNKVSDYFARIDENKFDTVIPRCINLIREKKVKEALDLCSGQNYTQQYIDIYEKNRKESIKKCIDFEISLLKYSSLVNKYDKIEDIYYKLVIYNMENTPIVFEYANFLYEHKKFDKAISWYKYILKHNDNISVIANVKNLLGEISFISEKYNDSEELYLSSIGLYDSLILNDYYEYSPMKADVIMNLAILYERTHNFIEAEKSFNEALIINQEFSILDSEKYLSKLAINLMDLASLYNNMGKDSISINFYLASIDIFKNLSKTNRNDYKSYLATSLNNLGLIYRKAQKYSESIESIKKSCSIFEELSKNCPSEYLAQLATIKLNLASINKYTLNYSQAEILYLDAINIYTQLNDIKPKESISQLSSTQNLLGLLYLSGGQYEKAEKMFIDALKIRKKLAENDIDNNLAKVADIQNNLGNVYEYTGKFDKAIDIYNKSLDLYTILERNGYYFDEKVNEIKENIKALNGLKK
jgi:tetratricopeptide (TPR) repeat protein